MPSGRYKIVLEGRILDGHKAETVKQALVRLLKVDYPKIDRMFDRAPIVIKKDLDYPSASRYKDALRRAGAAGRIEEMADPAAASLPPPLPAGDEGRPDDFARAGAEPQTAPAHRRRPSAGWYIGAVALFLIPMLIGGAIVIHGIFAKLSSGVDVPAPGISPIVIEQPDTYVLWYEPDAIGTERLSPGRDVRVKLFDRSTGQSLPLQPSTMEWVETSNGVERKALGRFTIRRPGRYQLQVDGEFAQTVFLLRRSLLSGWQTTILLPVLLCILGWVGGPLSALYLFVKRSGAPSVFQPQAITRNEERKWAMFSHIGTFAAFLVPFGNLIAPLVIWQLKKAESEFIVIHSKESLNFQISIFLYTVMAAALMIVVIGFFLLLAIGIFDIVMVIVAGLRANDGHVYRYPLTIRFIR